MSERYFFQIHKIYTYTDKHKNNATFMIIISYKNKHVNISQNKFNLLFIKIFL